MTVQTPKQKCFSQPALISPEHEFWLRKAQSFAETIPLDKILECDTTNTFPKDLFVAACKEGFGALPFPTTYGGAGSDYISFCLINEEFARRCLPIMSSLGVHVLCQEPIYRFGTEEQKQRYLIRAASGEYLGAFALTEPNAGSDTAALKTNARLIDNEYILNGTKIFITSGGMADFYIVMARVIEKPITSQTGEPTEISAFIVERNFPGLTIGQKFEMLGMRGYATCEIVFTDCRVPKANLLGKLGAGQKVALSSLAKGRITIAAQAVGWGQGAIDGVLRILHLNEHDSTMAETNSTWAMNDYHLGDMFIKLEAARSLTYNAALAVVQGQADPNLASHAKLYATDTAMTIATKALSLTGYEGLKPEYLLERIFRDAKAGQIYEGTNQIQRLLIARHLLTNNIGLN